MPDPRQSLQYAAVSDVGMRRLTNQDTYATEVADEEEWRRQGHLFVVADGMGAHAAGELASQQAVEEVVAQYRANRHASPPEALLAALEIANASIHRRGHEDTELYNMGTTCSTLALLPEGALVGHVGDSRVYLCRDERIQQLTFDHSLLWEMRAAGQIAKGDEHNSIIPRNVITRCLGPQADVKVDLEGPFSIRVEDVFVLCSDGLTGRVTDAEIGAAVGHLDPDASAQFLVDLANLRGGADNITVVVVKVTGDRMASRHYQQAAWQPSAPEPSPPRPHAAWWLVLGVALLAAMLLWGQGHWPSGLIAGVVALAASIGIGCHWLLSRSPRREQYFGEGPYDDVTCHADRSFVANIVETFELKLSSLAMPDEKLSDLRKEIDDLQKDAGAGATNICQQLADIARQLMAAVHEEIQSQSSDSSIEFS